MSPITLKLKEQPHVPLEAETLSPDALADLTHEEICARQVNLGKRVMRLDEFFDIEGEKSDELVIHGDLHNVKWVGRKMSRGQLTIHGSVGMHLGGYMRGGRIDVHGDSGDWVGAEMTGGLIHIHGNSGGQVGAAYRGSLRGMNEGTIIVDGTAGLEVGMRMRRGTIVIGGVCRDFAGLQMKGGNIVLLSGAELRTGAWMMRGTIISLAPLPLLPTFNYSCSYLPPFLRIYSRYLASIGIALPIDPATGSYQLYAGDASVPGKGELLVWQPS